MLTEKSRQKQGTPAMDELRPRRLVVSPWAITCLLLGLLALATDWPILLGQVPFPATAVLQFPAYDGLGSSQPPGFHAELGDLATQFYPWRTFAAQAVRQGTLPLWNPISLIGQPFLAEPQTALFSPLALLYYLLPTATVWAWSFPLRMLLAAVFTVLFTRAVGASMVGAAISGIVFSLCGFMIAWQGWVLAEVWLWLPLICYSIDRLQRRGTTRSIALAGFALAMPVLAGHPEGALHVTLVAILFALYRWLFPFPGSSRVGRARFIGLFTLAGLVAFSLAAAQLLPTLEWLSYIQRSLSDVWGALDGRNILALFSRDLKANPNSAGLPIPEGASYAGIMTLLLAPLALLHRPRGDALFLSVLLALALSIIYGWPPLFSLIQHTPILKGIPNSRLIALVDFGLAVLTGLGVTVLEQRLAKATRQELMLGWALLALAFAVCTLGISLVDASTKSRVQSLWWLYSPLASAALLLVGASVIGLRLLRWVSPRVFAGLTLTLVALDLFSASYLHVPFVPATDVFPTPPAFTFLAQQGAERFRTVPLDGTYAPNFELMYGLSTVQGYDFVLRRTQAFLAPLLADNLWIQLQADKVLTSPPALLDLLNVKYLVTATDRPSSRALASQRGRFALVHSVGRVQIYENLSVLPRAFLVPASGIQTARDDPTQLALVHAAQFDPRHSVILADAPTFEAGRRSGGEAMAGSAITTLAVGINDVRLHADIKEPTILVVSQAQYPGWRAWTNGTEVPVLRADYALMGVALGPGAHDIRLMFDPWTFRVGLAASCAGLVTLLVLIAWPAFRRRWRPK